MTEPHDIQHVPNEHHRHLPARESHIELINANGHNYHAKPLFTAEGKHYNASRLRSIIYQNRKQQLLDLHTVISPHVNDKTAT